MKLVEYIFFTLIFQKSNENFTNKLFYGLISDHTNDIYLRLWMKVKIDVEIGPLSCFFPVAETRS